MTNRKNRDEKPAAGLTDTFLGFRSSLERLLRRFVGPDDVDDIIGETYLRAYEHFRDDDIAYPKAFLYKTARNLALNYIARCENRLTQSIEDFPNPDVYLVAP